MPWQVVDRIVNGNVIDVRGAGLVRLAGIDDAGELSRAFLAGLITSHAVRVTPTAYSSGGMTEAFVYVPDGRCVNVEMLRSGYARVRITPGFERSSEFLGLQDDAKRLKRGLWAPPQPAASSAAEVAPTSFEPRLRRVFLAAGGGASMDSDARDWSGELDAGLFATPAVGFYMSAGYIRDVGDASTAAPDRAWRGSAGMMLASPARAALRPYVRAGGGYMRIETRLDSAREKRDQPFWEAAGGVIVTGGRVHTDIGYAYMRVDGLPVARVFGLFGIRF